MRSQRFSAFSVRGALLLTLTSLAVLAAADQTEACFRKRCWCKRSVVCRPVVCPVPVVYAAAPVPMPSAQAPPPSAQAAPATVFVTPKGTRHLVRFVADRGTEFELEEELREERAKLSPAEKAMAASNTDSFVGRDRKGAKTSIASASVEDFTDLNALSDTLTDDDTMAHHSPKITRDTQTRVTEENRNVRVSAFIYAVKSEADHDFHVILGTGDDEPSRTYFNAEISGLPASGPARAPLTAVRNDFKSHFAGQPFSSSGYHIFDPPVPVVVTGSLFWDVDHAPGVVGPGSMKPSTSWEIHPITSVDF